MILPALWTPCIVPGFGSEEADDFTAFQEILVDELNQLYVRSVEATDASFRCLITAQRQAQTSAQIH